MANEHVLVTQKTLPVSMTVANATGIEKGTLLKSTDPDTCIASSAANDPIAGIAYTEKIASDGNTRMAVLSGPGDVLKAVASGTISQGDPLVSAIPAGNLLASAKFTGNLSGSQFVGRSLEAATDGQTFLYVLNISTGWGAT